ncbi:unnamed protein product [Spirodela intermedia]|uniref:acid phosphatase n=1 Tax=Spirodela intermedia TaxID=51605 RepID=A0A7I8L667_SPIIN|nr:unnamed protein product [Spirodela intermedia]
MASSYLFAGTAGPSLPDAAAAGAAASAAAVRAVLRTRLPFAPCPSPLPACLAPVSQESLHTRLTRLPSVRPTPSAAAADSADSAASSRQPQPFSVLFVCLGNICRSPAAEGVFSSLVTNKGLDAHFKIDSAGTIGYHEGDLADPRMRAASKKRGIEITSISRPIRPSDFKDFDLILAMDLQNKDDILAKYELWSFKEPLPADAQRKVKLICSYCTKHRETEVPDPYYGGPQGFEKVLDLLEDACDSLLDSILTQSGHISSS